MDERLRSLVGLGIAAFSGRNWSLLAMLRKGNILGVWCEGGDSNPYTIAGVRT